MSFLSKMFGMKKENDNLLSSSELGKYLFGLCLRNSKSFIDSLKEQQEKNKELLKINIDDIDVLELTIVFMWSYFDLLQVEKYRKSLDVMHNHFFDFVKKRGEDAKRSYELLSARYDKYRQNFRNQSKPDYSKVAHLISANIQHLDSPCTNIILHTMITITIQENILNTGKAILKTSPRD
jgi:hypothetical protein